MWRQQCRPSKKKATFLNLEPADNIRPDLRDFSLRRPSRRKRGTVRSPNYGIKPLLGQVLWVARYPKPHSAGKRFAVVGCTRDSRKPAHSLRRVVDHARWGVFRKEMLSLVEVVLWVAEAMGLLEGFMLVVTAAPNPSACDVKGPHTQPKS